MKRILCVCFAVAFAAALGFGQELKLDGYVNSGLGVVVTDDSDEDASLMIYGVDSERNIGRFRLNGAYTNEAKNAGANFRFQVQGSGSFSSTSGAEEVSGDEHSHTVRYPANAPSLAYGYGWVKPHDMVNIKFGLVDDGTWATADVLFNDDQGEGAGVLVRATPMAGLDIGVGAYLLSYASGGSNNFLPVNASTGIAMKDARYTFNVAYTMDKLFRFTGSFRTLNETGGNGDLQPSQALLEFRLLSVDNLTAILVGQLVGLQGKDGASFGDNGRMTFYETFGYKMGDLGFGLNAAQYMNNADNTDISLLFNPWVSYSLNEGGLVPRLDVAYFKGGLQNGTNYHRKAWAVRYDSDAYVFSARPSVKLNLDSRNALELGDVIYYQDNGKDSKFTNVFYLDFVTRF